MKYRSQEREILEILIRKGESGLNSFEYRQLYIQLPARIKGLKRKGHTITSVRQKNKSVNYILNKDSRHEREGIDYTWEFENGVAIRKALC